MIMENNDPKIEAGTTEMEEAEQAPTQPLADQPLTEAVIPSAPAEPSEGETTETKPRPAPRLTAARPWVWGVGRRKAAVARVRIKPGSGTFKVNNRDIDRYFAEERDRADIVAPLKVSRAEGNFDVFVNVRGGGMTGQAGAIKLGLARALLTYDESFEASLREHNLLTRDPRKVERKKYGQPGARRRFQFSKR
jgi:small subunit ribosomal protein S9